MTKSSSTLQFQSHVHAGQMDNLLTNTIDRSDKLTCAVRKTLKYGIQLLTIHSQSLIAMWLSEGPVPSGATFTNMVSLYSQHG